MPWLSDHITDHVRDKVRPEESGCIVNLSLLIK